MSLEAASKFSIAVAVAVAALFVTHSANAQDPRFVQLTGDQIRQELSGMHVSYDPPGWADLLAGEAYRPDGTWRGSVASVGTVIYSGRWFVENSQLCLLAASVHRKLPSRPERFCRKIWRHRATNTLWMRHLTDRQPEMEFGMQRLERQPIVPAQ
ncbi:hypothetical protein [Sphingomonas spermidinifaciens]|uniref:hypothetical protein n=1 Tax=Sphingomonas spermidinifaciens TaxID=1141889 RepID=UPI001143F74A|nr:hypothetical protein [Sphingomonas spermidinifaciens]